MANKQAQIQKNKPSELSKFNLGFEYDKTDAQVRRDIRVRADKTTS